MLYHKNTEIKNKTFLEAKKGAKLLPDLRTAIFASLRGYFQGSYPSKLEGAAENLGYYPLSEATEEELGKINKIIEEISKMDGVDLSGTNS